MSNGHDLIDLGRHAVEINRHNGLGLTACDSNTVVDSLLKQLGIHVPGFFLGVDHHWCGTQILDGMGRCTKRKTLHQNLVARTNATGKQPEVDCCRT